MDTKTYATRTTFQTYASHLTQFSVLVIKQHNLMCENMVLVNKSLRSLKRLTGNKTASFLLGVKKVGFWSS